MTKIDIFSGFLGAGKTTLIKKLIKESFAGQKVVLIENEFGEIGIDGGFLKESGIQINELNAGCICCSLVGDFRAALQQVVEQYHPDRIVIEPSGVGKLSDVTRAVEGVAEHLDVQLSSFVTVADVNKVKMYMKNFGEFFSNQIEYAGTIILSRTDKVDQAKLNACVEMIREHNDKATIITTPLDQLDGREVLKTIEGADKLEDMMKEMLEHIHDDHDEDECCDHEHHHHHDHDGGACGCGHDEEECGCGHDHEHHHHHDGEACSCGHDHHHADEVFTSWGLENVAAMKREDLDRILDELAYGDQYGEVLRAKGMVPGEKEGSWLYFDLVPEQYEIRDGSPEYTGKVCVIGAKLKEDELKKAFGR